MTTPRIGLLGTGDAAGLHVEHLRAADAEVAWVSGRTPERGHEFADRWQVGEVVDDVAAMVAREPDAVVVATPSDLHAEQVRTCLDAGVAVLCEIPLATNLADLIDLAEREAGNGSRLMVAHTLRFDAAHRALLAELADEPALHLVARRLMLRQTDTGWMRATRSWTDDVVWHHGTHEVDRARWLLGATADDPVRATGATGPVWPGSGKPMDLSATLVSGDGRLASLSLSYHSRHRAVDLTVIGERHTWRTADGSLWRDDDLVVEGDPRQWESFNVAAQDAAFVEALRSGEPMSPGSAEALAAGVVLDGLSRPGSSPMPG
ncbi:Gfo/Idh/MocA family protein [Propionibacteriaceae bacterium Y2011]